MNNRFNFVGNIVIPKETSKRPLLSTKTIEYVKNGKKISQELTSLNFGVRESDTNMAFIEVVDNPRTTIKAKDTDNIVTGRYTGHPCRNIKTKFAKKLAMGEKEGTLTPDEFEKLTLGALRRAVVDGDVDSGSFLCGAISGMVNDIKSCADIVKEINDGAEKLLGR